MSEEVAVPKGMSRRLGKFRIPRRTIESNPEAAIAVLEGCIVVRAEMMWSENAIEYVAIHPHFDVMVEGNTIPYYGAKITLGRREWDISADVLR